MRKDITGQEFGWLTAIEPAGHDRRGNVIWRCRCRCGTITTATANALIWGRKKSCGCIRSDMNRESQAGKFNPSLFRGQIMKNNTSGHRGIYRERNGRYRASITVNGEYHYLGRYDRIEDAIAAREDGERKYLYPLLSNLNKNE